jgi:HAD superfamily hydrolase (TIGR01484 family)
MKKLVFSDLDGTFLDHDTYSYEKAKNSLELIKKREIPLIFCTSKTRREIEYWREKIGNKDPFISENGGGIFIPRSYFSFKFLYDKKSKNYFIISLGAEFKKLKKIIKLLKKKFEIQDFNKTRPKEVIYNNFKKHLDYLDNAYIYVRLKRHYEQSKGIHIIFCKIRLSSPKGMFIASDEGWGYMDAINKACEAIEKQIRRNKRR